jgi:hypothetical protein
MFTIMAIPFPDAADKNKSRDVLAASAESLSFLYCLAEWLRSCTSAANGNQKPLNGRKLLNRVPSNGIEMLNRKVRNTDFPQTYGT